MTNYAMSQTQTKIEPKTINQASIEAAEQNPTGSRQHPNESKTDPAKSKLKIAPNRKEKCPNRTEKAMIKS